MSGFDFISKFILFVIPGFIAVTIFLHLTGKEIPDKIPYLLYILLASILSCLGANILIFLGNYLWETDCPTIAVTEILSGNQESLRDWGLYLSLAASGFLGILAATISNRNLLFKISNFLKLTPRSNNDAVWDELFITQPWVIVRDYVTKLNYYGRVSKYSDKCEIREMLLEDVSVTGNQIKYHMKQVYLARNPSEFSIEVDDYAAQKEKK